MLNTVDNKRQLFPLTILLYDVLVSLLCTCKKNTVIYAYECTYDFYTEPQHLQCGHSYECQLDWNCNL